MYKAHAKALRKKEEKREETYRGSHRDEPFPSPHRSYPQLSSASEVCWLKKMKKDQLLFSTEKKISKRTTSGRKKKNEWETVREHTRQQKHIPFLNHNILNLAFIHNLQRHRALVLIKPLFSGVNMEINTGVGSTDDHGDEVGAFVETFIANWGFEEI